MEKVASKLKVFFDGPFWTGVFEHTENKKLSVCKITFGDEPKGCEIYDFILQNHYRLKFSPSVEVFVNEVKKNPKRRQKEISKQM